MYDLAGALQFSLIGFVVVGTFIDAAYFDMLYYLIAIVVIMKQILAYSALPVSSPKTDSVVAKRVLEGARSSF
jgi:hypothetical protein